MTKRIVDMTSAELKAVRKYKREWARAKRLSNPEWAEKERQRHLEWLANNRERENAKTLRRWHSLDWATREARIMRHVQLERRKRLEKRRNLLTEDIEPRVRRSSPGITSKELFGLELRLRPLNLESAEKMKS